LVKVGDINIRIKIDRSWIVLIYLLVLRHIGQNKIFFYGRPQAESPSKIPAVLPVVGVITHHSSLFFVVWYYAKCKAYNKLQELARKVNLGNLDRAGTARGFQF